MIKFIPNIKHSDSGNFFLIAGPCIIENDKNPFEIAEKIIGITDRLKIPYIFKASYRKANRSKLQSFTGIGDREGLEILKAIRDTYHVPVLTDIHTPEEAVLAAEYADILQIPAFLCRQTELLTAAAATGKVVNIKKGQFLSADAMKFAVEKVRQSGNDRIMLTERGNMFGYQEVNYSEGALRFMHDELKALEEEYLRLFTGVVVKSNFTFSFTHLPTTESIGKTLSLFRLSKNTGIVEAGGAGEPVSIMIETSGNTATVLDINGSSELISNTAPHGLFYRIPEEAEIKILFRGNTAAQLQTPISQFGLVSVLPTSVSNVEFDGSTGGLKSLKLEAE